MSPVARNRDAIESFSLLGQACFGVAIGVLLAVAIARMTLPPDGPATAIPAGLLPWNLHNILLKPREKTFYVLSLGLGGLLGYLATWRRLPGLINIAVVWIVVLLSVLVGSEIIGATLAGGSPYLPVILAFGGTGLFLFALVGRAPPAVARQYSARQGDKRRRLWPYLTLLLLLTIVLIPSSFNNVAAKIGFDFHAVSFLFGPTLYFLGNNLLPGIDYYSQYSIGIPWFFHFIMGYSAAHAVLVYTVFVIAVTWCFYAHLIYLLGWLYRSWVAAAFVAFTALILSFCFPPDHQAYFYGPSNGVLRYPLLTLCALLTGLWAETPRSSLRLLAAGAAAALSIFLEFETGLIMLVAAALTVFAVNPWRLSTVATIGAFFAATSAVLGLILLTVFGTGAMQPEFFRRLFEPVLIFGVSGFSGTRMVWILGDWNWLYHLVAPGASLATVAVIARACGADAADRRRAGVLGFLAISGLLLMGKYVNQSVAGVWQMSAIGPLGVIAWWCVALLRRIAQWEADLVRGTKTRRHEGRGSFRQLVMRNTAQRIVGAVMVVVALVFLWSPSETGSSAKYGLMAWVGYPSLLAWPFVSEPEQECVRMGCVPNRPAAADISLITSRTKPGEQVAIVDDPYDWTFLLDAHRPPLMAFLPSVDIFTTWQLDESLRRLRGQKYVFVPKGQNGAPYAIDNGDLRAAVGPLLGTVYQRDGEGDRLVAWKRIAP